MKILLNVLALLGCVIIRGQSVQLKHSENKKPANDAITEINLTTNIPLEFKVKKHDFGKIKKGIPVTYEFEFTNISDKSLIIESATAQCGCTTPVFPKSEIMKGESNKITITYNASNPGIFMKQVTLKLLHYSTPYYLVVSGEVMPSAPQKVD